MWKQFEALGRRILSGMFCVVTVAVSQAGASTPPALERMVAYDGMPAPGTRLLERVRTGRLRRYSASAQPIAEVDALLAACRETGSSTRLADAPGVDAGPAFDRIVVRIHGQ